MSRNTQTSDSPFVKAGRGMVFRTMDGKTWLLDEVFTAIEISDFEELYTTLPHSCGEVVEIDAEEGLEMCNLKSLYSVSFDDHPSMARLVAAAPGVPELKERILASMREPVPAA